MLVLTNLWNLSIKCRVSLQDKKSHTPGQIFSINNIVAEKCKAMVYFNTRIAHIHKVIFLQD